LSFYFCAQAQVKKVSSGAFFLYCCAKHGVCSCLRALAVQQVYIGGYGVAFATLYSALFVRSAIDAHACASKPRENEAK
jgi:hypothetical protein